MGLHIDSKLINVANKIQVEVDLSKFSDRQLNNIVNQVKHGHVGATSATSQLAYAISKTFNLRFMRSDTYSTSFYGGLLAKDIKDKLIGLFSIAKLHPSNTGYRTERLTEEIKALDEGRHQGSVSTWMLGEAKNNLRNIKLPIPQDHEVHAYLDKIKSREIKFIKINLNDAGKGTYNYDERTIDREV